MMIFFSPTVALFVFKMVLNASNFIQCDLWGIAIYIVGGQNYLGSFWNKIAEVI